MNSLNAPEWINEAALSAAAFLQLNLEQPCTLVVTPAQIVFCRSDGMTYQCSTTNLQQALISVLPDVSVPAETLLPDPPVPPPTLAEIDALSDSPLTSPEYAPDSPPPLPEPLDFSFPDFIDDFGTTPTLDELKNDLRSTEAIPIPDLALPTDTMERLQRLWRLYAQEVSRNRRSTSTSTRSVHTLQIAYLFSEIRQSHPLRFRQFMDWTYTRGSDRTRRYFSSTATRAYNLGQCIGLARLLASRLLTYHVLKMMSCQDFDNDLLPSLYEEES